GGPFEPYLDRLFVSRDFKGGFEHGRVKLGGPLRNCNYGPPGEATDIRPALGRREEFEYNPPLETRERYFDANKICDDGLPALGRPARSRMAGHDGRPARHEVANDKPKPVSALGEKDDAHVEVRL